MRLWTLHPRYLDPQGLTALWREALLAQKVLQGKTKGYKHHPQLDRFKATRSPVAAIGKYLAVVAGEASRRKYNFRVAKIASARFRGTVPVGEGQLLYEWKRLKAKLRTRSPRWYRLIRAVEMPRPHPVFRVIPGPIAPWERVADASRGPARSAGNRSRRRV